jgi:hypothetical protein
LKQTLQAGHQHRVDLLFAGMHLELGQRLQTLGNFFAAETGRSHRAITFSNEGSMLARSGPVGASLLAKNVQATRSSRQPALSFTSIARAGS